ncbi:MAG: hypothetical protein MUO21_02105 [Nitrososphaeraceae archaeon]|nr:hypothetical protein [Nitrososphaeraceae archaeon]
MQQQQQVNKISYAKYIPWIWIAMILDLLLIIGFIIIHILWLENANLTIMFSLLAILSSVHTFSWFAGYALTKHYMSKFYMFFFSFIYFLSVFLNLLSLILRLIIYFLCGSDGSSCDVTLFGYNFGQPYTSDDQIYILLSGIWVIAFIVLSLVQAIIGVEMYKTLIQYYETLGKQDPNDIKSSEMLYRARGVIRGLYVIEFVLAISLIVIAALGVSVTTTFEYLTFGQLIHLFLWVGIRVIAGSSDKMLQGVKSDAINSMTYIVVVMMLVVLEFIGSGIVFVWRFIILVTCDTCSFDTFESTINLLFSIFMNILDFVLLVISLVYMVAVPMIINQKEKESNEQRTRKNL